MRELFLLVTHLLATVARLMRPGGVRAVAAESLLLKHQLLILNRSRKRAPHLTPWDRLLLGFGSLFVHPERIQRIAVALKPSTFPRFHQALTKLKYHLLYASGCRRRPGPKGPSRELIAAIVEMKRRNPRFGCQRIAQEIAHAFGVEIDKDIVRRVLAKHCRPESRNDGPSWLTVIGHLNDSLWSVDLFRCESILLRSYWVMVVMDVFTRRVIAFGVQRFASQPMAIGLDHAIAQSPLSLASCSAPPVLARRVALCPTVCRIRGLRRRVENVVAGC
jgi:putative transposase